MAQRYSEVSPTSLFTCSLATQTPKEIVPVDIELYPSSTFFAEGAANVTYDGVHFFNWNL